MKRCGLLLGLAAAGWAVVAATPAGPKPDAGNAKARADAARSVYEGVLRLHSVEPRARHYELLYRWSRRWMDVEQQAAGKSQRVAAAKAHLSRMRDLES